MVDVDCGESLGIIIIDDAVLRAVNVSCLGFSFIFARTSFACAVIASPQPSKRHSDRASIPSYCCKKFECNLTDATEENEP